MAQVNVNFRMDEDVKRRMERACKEMGLSMTTAFTMFATKVGKEKRIPFEISANPSHNEHRRLPDTRDSRPSVPSEPDDFAVLEEKREYLEDMCVRLRRAMTSIHTAIPSAALGLTVERIRLLCSDGLKDKIAACVNSFRGVLSERNLEAVKGKDLEILEEYINGLSAILTEVEDIERTLVPALKGWQEGTAIELVPVEQRLADVSGQFDELQAVMRRFMSSAARKQGTAQGVLVRLRRAAGMISDPEVIAELRVLEALVRRYYDSLDDQTRGRLEAFYLQTMELAVEELGNAEQYGEDTLEKAGLCLRTLQVISQTVSSGSRVQRELSARNLEAEVAALERIAAMRGDVADSMG